MGADKACNLCQGVLEKKVSHRRLPIGPAWKRKHCVLNSEALHIYRNSKTLTEGCRVLRTVPLCHIKSVSIEYNSGNVKYFDVETEQGETLSFRHKDDTEWVAQLQLQLIQYKNRQDISRYKQLNNRMALAESTIQRLRASNLNSNDITDCSSSRSRQGRSIRGCRTVVLPNHKHNGLGIGVTVIPLYDGRIVVNRVVEEGPAMQLGVLQPRDEILLANGRRVTNVDMLSEVVRNSPETVTLVIKPRLSKLSSDKEDPKALLKQREITNPEYINTICESNEDDVLKRGHTEKPSQLNNPPAHFKFA